MKKIILISGLILASFLGYGIADACTASSVCSDGSTVSCWGINTCVSGPGWALCDGTNLSKCDDFEPE